MNLSAENIGQIRELVRSGYPLKARDAQDLLGHNDHLIELLEARGRLMLGVEIERDQLKAEVAGLKTGYEAYEQVVQGLKAENEALRDDLEQVQYEADAWRNREESLWIEVYYGKGDDPPISAVQGAICIEELAKIQGVFLEYPDDYFEHGSGLYVFRCGHHEAHYDNVGMTEPAHWEIEFESHSRFPWADEQPSTCGSEQDQNSTETPIPERSACRSESP